MPSHSTLKIVGGLLGTGLVTIGIMRQQNRHLYDVAERRKAQYVYLAELIEKHNVPVDEFDMIALHNLGHGPQS